MHDVPIYMHLLDSSSERYKALPEVFVRSRVTVHLMNISRFALFSARDVPLHPRARSFLIMRCFPPPNESSLMEIDDRFIERYTAARSGRDGLLMTLMVHRSIYGCSPLALSSARYFLLLPRNCLLWVQMNDSLIDIQLRAVAKMDH